VASDYTQEQIRLILASSFLSGLPSEDWQNLDDGPAKGLPWTKSATGASQEVKSVFLDEKTVYSPRLH